MVMQTKFHSTYMDANIYRQHGGSTLPYTALVHGHGTMSADTLVGVKRLIRDAVKGE